jgi:tellurite resistance protein TerC
MCTRFFYALHRGKCKSPGQTALDRRSTGGMHPVVMVSDDEPARPAPVPSASSGSVAWGSSAVPDPSRLEPPMDVPVAVWALTLAGVAGLLLFDFVVHVRRAHVPTLREAAAWSALYVGIALAFGVGLWFVGGAGAGTEYFAGYVTEKALSVDNLFVFLVIMSSFAVPRADQQKVLLVGIVLSLLARTGLIFLGTTLIHAFAWVFYLFGGVLLITAVQLLRSTDDDRSADTLAVRLARRFVRTSENYDGDRLFTRVDGKRVMTPMLLVMVAIGGTDVMFALDSIPAIFGLTQDVYVVLTATAFSLLGLRQLYFLVDGLLDRLVYLSYGLATVLGLIGVKLVLHALHENTVPFVNGGEPVDVPEIGTGLSLAVIVVVLAVTVTASLLGRRDPGARSPEPEARTASTCGRSDGR